MREENTKDKVWSIVLIATAAMALLLGVIPGFFQVYDPDQKVYQACNFFNAPPSSIMSNFCPVLLVGIGYTLVLTICYLRSQALGTIKAIFVFSVAVLCLSALALLPQNTVKPMPYSIMVVLWAVMSVLSFIRMKQEIARYDFD